MSRRFELQPSLSVPHFAQVTVLPEHCDLYGHVNNAAYLVLLEIARWDLIASGGWGPERVAKERKGPVILDLHLRFKHEAEQGEALSIETWVTQSDARLFTLQQRMRKADGAEACLAELVFCFFDLDRRRMIPPPEDFKRSMRLKPAEKA